MGLFTALRSHDLAPAPRTHATARFVSRLDRTASGTLWVCWWVLSLALWVSVAVVLRLEQWKRIADEPRSQWVRRPGQRHGFDFHCAWCGGKTAEGDTPLRTCCGMAMAEWWRANPRGDESW